MKETKRICVVGAGKWGENHVRTLRELGCLGAIVDSDADRLSNLQEKYGAKGYLRMEDALRDGYDGYTVATPAATHAAIGGSLLKRGSNVLIEKPLAMSTGQSQELLDLSDRYGGKLMVGHLMLFHPAILKIKELMDSGRLGRIYYLSLSRLNFGTVRNYEDVLWSFAPHDISILNELLHESPSAVTANAVCCIRNELADVVSARLDYPGGAKGYLAVSWLFPFKERRIVAVGSRAMLSFDDASPNRKIYVHQKAARLQDGIPLLEDGGTEAIDFENTSPLKSELEYFVDHLESGPSIADGKSGYEVVRVLERISDQMKRGQNTSYE